MPKIKPRESQKSYIDRCIPYVMEHEGATREQAAGKCHGMWKYKKKKGES